MYLHGSYVNGCQCGHVHGIDSKVLDKELEAGKGQSGGRMRVDRVSWKEARLGSRPASFRRAAPTDFMAWRRMRLRVSHESPALA